MTERIFPSYLNVFPFMEAHWLPCNNLLVVALSDWSPTCFTYRYERISTLSIREYFVNWIMWRKFAKQIFSKDIYLNKLKELKKYKLGLPIHVRVPWNDSQVEPPLRTGRTLTTHFEKTCKTIHVRLLAIHAGRRFIHDKGHPCLPFFTITGLRYSPTSHTFPCVCRSLWFSSRDE